MKKSTKNSAAKAAKKPKKSTKRPPPTIPKLKAAVQAKANLHARLRDCFGEAGAPCISCGKWTPFEKGDGGHFIATTSSAIRFDERNINFQCHKCNRFLHGNQRHYYKAMLAKYGEAVVAELEAQEFTVKKWTREELIEIRKQYNERIKSIRAGKLPVESTGNSGLSMSDLFDDLPPPSNVL